MNLHKDERVNLSRTGTPLSQVVMALTWEPLPGRKKVDLDASVIAFDAAGKRLAIVWHMNLDAFYGALRHGGDNQTGQGTGEQIFVDLSRVPDQVAALVFTVNSFRDQTFVDIANAQSRLIDAQTGAELVRFELSDTHPNTAVLMSQLRRCGPGLWDMRAIGEFHDCRTVKKLVPFAARQAQLP